MTNLKSLLDNGLIWFADHKTEEQAQKIEHIFNVKPISSKTQSAKLSCSFDLPSIDNALPFSGLQFGSIHEFFSTNKFPPCSLLTFLANNSLKKSKNKKFIIWIGKEIWPTAFALRDFLENCIFIDPPNEKLLLWSLETALSSPAVASVITKTKNLKFSTTRRLNLAAQRGATLGLIVRDKPTNSFSAAATRWSIKPIISASAHPRFELKLLKCKASFSAKNSWQIEIQFEPEIKQIIEIAQESPELLLPNPSKIYA